MLPVDDGTHWKTSVGEKRAPMCALVEHSDCGMKIGQI